MSWFPFLLCMSLRNTGLIVVSRVYNCLLRSDKAEERSLATSEGTVWSLYSQLSTSAGQGASRMTKRRLCVCSSIFHSYIVQNPLPRQWCHSKWTGSSHTYPQNNLHRLSSQVVLDCIQLTTKANHHTFMLAGNSEGENGSGENEEE